MSTTCPLTIVCLVVVFVLQPCGRGQDVAEESFPMVTGDSHASGISQICSDSAGNRLLTLGGVGDARLWDVASKRLLRVILPPKVRRDGFGAVYSIALSPDGRLAAGARSSLPDGDAICIFDAETGQMVRVIGTLKGRVMDLTFSPDGKLLASVQMGKGDTQGSALMIYGMDGNVYAEDQYPQKNLLWMTWHAATGLVVTGEGFHVRLYGQHIKKGKLLPLQSTAVKGVGNRQPQVSGDGRSLGLSGFIAVGIHDMQTLALRGEIRFPDTKHGFVSGFVLSRDANLVQVCGRVDDQWRGVIDTWRLSANKPASLISSAKVSAAVRTMCPAGIGRNAFACSDGSIGMITESGRIEWIRETPWYHFHRADGKLLLNADASALMLDLPNSPGRRLVFSLTQRRCQEVASDGNPEGFEGPLQSGLPVTEWFDPVKGSGKVLLQGQPVKPGYYFSTCLAISPDGERFVVGMGPELWCFTAHGTVPWWHRLSAVPTAVNFSQDGRVVVMAAADGSIRWLSAEEKAPGGMRELLALQPSRDGKRWVIFTPQGYFDASPDGHELLGILHNRGDDGTAVIVPMTKAMDTYYRPDIVQEVWRARDASKATELASKRGE